MKKQKRIVNAKTSIYITAIMTRNRGGISLEFARELQSYRGKCSDRVDNSVRRDQYTDMLKAIWN